MAGRGVAWGVLGRLEEIDRPAGREQECAKSASMVGKVQVAEQGATWLTEWERTWEGHTSPSQPYGAMLPGREAC